MRYDQLIQLYFERSSALQWYWTLYVVIIGGLLAFSSMRKERDWRSTLLVSTLYVLFAYKNLGAIEDVTLQRVATIHLIKTYNFSSPIPVESKELREALEPMLTSTDYEGVHTFHIACDALTIGAIWAMEMRRKRLVTISSSI